MSDNIYIPTSGEVPRKTEESRLPSGSAPDEKAPAGEAQAPMQAPPQAPARPKTAGKREKPRGKEKKNTEKVSRNANIPILETSEYKKLCRRHQRFIDAYIRCYFNATQAYMMCYPRTSYDSARTDAARLLTKAHIQRALEERVSELKFWEDFSEKDWAKLGFELLRKSKSESVRARIWEVLGRAKQIFREGGTQSVAVFTAVGDITQRILARRGINERENTEVIEPQKVER